MELPVYNPYEYIRSDFNDALDYIIANIPTSNASYDDIVDGLVAYLGTLPDPPEENSIKAIRAISYNSANDYINSRISDNLNFGPEEMAFIDSVLHGLKTNGIESLNEFLNACIQELTASNINTLTKAPIYAALALAQESYAYWIAVVGTPGDWANYINANAAINYANIPNWVAVAFMASFSGFAQVIAVAQPQATALESEGRGAAVNASGFAATVVSAGKVIVKWAKRPNVSRSTTMFSGSGGCGCGSF